MGSWRTVGSPGDDHYLWLTSLVSAHHLQRPTCWLIAAIAALLGVMPLVVLEAHPGVHAPVRVAVAVGITVCATGIAVVWVSRCWPTRRRSRASAVLGTACVAAAVVVVIPDPLLAAVGALAFAGPAGFTALLHTRALLLGSWAVGVLTLSVAAWRLAAVAVVEAVVVVTLVVLINLFAAFAWLLVRHLIEPKVVSASTDAVTGLLNWSGFEDRMLTVLGARERARDRYLVIVVISVDTHGLLMSLGQSARADRAVLTAAHQLRATVRRDTVLAYRGDGVFLLAELFATADPAIMLERFRGALTARPARLSASIGAVSTVLAPLGVHPVGEVLAELVGLAEQARDHAHRGGGNTVRAVIDPPLAILDDPFEAI